MRNAALVACFGLATACAAPVNAPTPGADRGDGSREWIVGHVRVVGSMPVDVRTVIAPEGGSAVEIRGELRDEIRRLNGAEIAVFGTRSGDLLDASDYQVRSVDGAPVLAGVVEAAPDGGLQLRTDRGEVIRIEGMDQSIRPGQKVWLQGPASIRVQSYGVIRP